VLKGEGIVPFIKESSMSKSKMLSSSLTNTTKPVNVLVSNAPVRPIVSDFYQTDIVARNSTLMADCSKNYAPKTNFKK
jgi:hypothetical protein